MPAFKAAEAELQRAGLEGLSIQTAEILSGLSKGQIPPNALMPPTSYFLGTKSQETKPDSKQVPSEMAIDRIRQIDEVFGILSLSMTSDNLLLWAHYASEHRGLAAPIPSANPYSSCSIGYRR